MLSSCSEKVHDVQYYLDHQEERIEKTKECRSNPGKSQDDPNCINAFEAEHKAMFRGNKMPKIKVDF